MNYERRASSLPNISTLYLRFWDPQGQSPLQANVGKFRDMLGYLVKNIDMSTRRPMQGIWENHTEDPECAIWGNCHWRLRNAKVDKLGKGEISPIS